MKNSYIAKNVYLPVAVANMFTFEMLKMSLTAQRLIRRKDQETVKMQHDNPGCLLSIKREQLSGKERVNYGTWIGRVFLEKVAPEQSFENK